MSGLLRRIKRSRTAGAGEAPAGSQAAAPDDAPTTADGSADAPVPASATPTGAPTAELPAAETEAIELAQPEPAPAEPEPEPAVAEPDAPPETPAGEEPVELAVRAPIGRRGRLRRRLRYLRRARELMLRDLGGLFYEIHRTGGGRVDAYATVVDAKVERIAGVDAEARALETALMAPRGETVLFEPGVGGTCDVCGELYGSSARFCSSCGTATDAAARTPPPAAMPQRPAMPQAPPREPEPEPEPQAEQPPPDSDQPTRALDVPQDAARTAEQPAVDRPDAPAAEPPADDQPGERGDARNGSSPPGRSSGDPLVARESGS